MFGNPKAEMKQRFVRQLAVYLVREQAKMSMLLEQNDPVAIEWARLRNETPLQGYPTVQEAQDVLAEFFNVSMSALY